MSRPPNGLQDRTVTALNAIAILTWTAMALWRLPSGGHFLFDEAYFFEKAVRFATALEWPAYGPFISSTDPVVFTPGGALWVLLAPPFLFTQDPRAGTAWIIFLSALGSWLLDRALRRSGVPPAARLATVVLEVFSVWHARFADRIWNVNLFYFLAPAMLFLAVRLVERGRLREWALLGLTGAAATQVHASGVMPFAVCLALVAFKRPASLRGWAVPVLVVAVLLPYVPYVIVEAQHGFQNTRRLPSARPPGPFDMAGVREGSRAPVVYASQADWFRDLTALRDPRSPVFPAAVTLLAALGFALVGLFQPSPLRLVAWLSWLGLPAYFVATARGFGHYYLTAVMPFCTLFAGAGAGYLLTRPSRLVRGAVLGYLVLLPVGALRRVIRDYPAEWTVARQLEVTRRVLADPARWAPPDGEELLTCAVLAHRVEGRELVVQRDGKRWTVDIQENPEPGTRFLHMGAVRVPVAR